jgi:hypothetical protein
LSTLFSSFDIRVDPHCLYPLVFCGMSTKMQAITAMWIGFIFQVWSGWDFQGDFGSWLPWSLLLVGLTIFTFGCVRWCQHLGYPGIVGLFGLLSCLGLALMLILPNRRNPQEDLYMDE